MSSHTTAQEAGASTPATPPRENLYRINPEIALTRADGAEMPTLTGHFAVWDQWTEIRSAYEGNFMERFAPSSMNKTLAEGKPKVLFQHGKDPQIGDKVLGPITRVEPDSDGAYYEVPLLDTSYNRDLIPGLEAGLYGASFRFSVLQEDVVQRPKRSAENPRGIPERTVTEARVMEFGPVTFPAYAGATAGVRSITDDILLGRFLDDDELRERLRAMTKQKPSANVVRVSLNGVDVPTGKTKDEERADWTSIQVLSEMNSLGQWFIALESAPDDDGDESDDIAAMQNILQQIDTLVQSEAAEPDDGGRSADTTDFRADETEPSEATTHTEPEPSAATTRSRTDLFWFVEHPSSKGAK